MKKQNLQKVVFKQKFKTIIALLALVFTLKSKAQTKADLDWIALSGGDITKVAIKKEPGRNAIEIEEVIHSKEITIDSEEALLKWTELGYGSLTHKVILPSLAKHTLLNHRNDGEDGPCLRSDYLKLANKILDSEGKVLDQGSPNDNKDNLPKDILVKIQIKNNYIIDKAEGVCKVQLLEEVRTVINNEEFYHVLVQDMGFRFIEDCPN